MLKTLTKQIKEYKKNAILTTVFIVLEISLELLIPFFMSQIIDKGVLKQDINSVYYYGFLLVITSILALSAGLLAARNSSIAVAGFAKNLRRAQFERIQSFDFNNIDKFSDASLITRITTDINSIQRAFHMLLTTSFRVPFMILGSIVMVALINSKLLIIYATVLVPFAFILAFLLSKAFPYAKKLFDIYDELNKTVQEDVRGIYVVKSYVREEYEIKKFNKISLQLYKLFRKTENFLITLNPMMLLAIYSCIIAVSYIGAGLVVSGSLTTGQLMSLFSYNITIMMALFFTCFIVITITLNLPSARRIVDVINETPTIKNPSNPVKTVVDGSISFKDVNFKYTEDNEIRTLSNINFDIKSGEMVGIIGPTGSGKSSLIQLINRLYDVNSGAVLVGGVDVKNYDLKVLRDAVSVALQKNVLFSGTIIENLRWAKKDASLEEIKSACEIAEASEFIEGFKDKYETVLEQGGGNVSGGQRQRLCIARAILKNPKILMLDDSTSAVDTKTDAQIVDAFNNKLKNMTKIIVSQRISSIKNADKIIVLEDGKVVSIGNHEELLENNAFYNELNEMQTKGGVISE